MALLKPWTWFQAPPPKSIPALYQAAFSYKMGSSEKQIRKDVGAILKGGCFAFNIQEFVSNFRPIGNTTHSTCTYHLTNFITDDDDDDMSVELVASVVNTQVAIDCMSSVNTCCAPRLNCFSIYLWGESLKAFQHAKHLRVVELVDVHDRVYNFVDHLEKMAAEREQLTDLVATGVFPAACPRCGHSTVEKYSLKRDRCMYCGQRHSPEEPLNTVGDLLRGISNE